MRWFGETVEQQWPIWGLPLTRPLQLRMAVSRQARLERNSLVTPPMPPADRAALAKPSSASPPRDPPTATSCGSAILSPP